MKETPPQLEASDMPDPRKMSREELALVPFDKWRLFCGVEGCTHFTHVRDYGIWPLLSWGNMRGWIRVDLQRFICAKHWKIYSSPGVQTPYKDYYSIDETRKTILECPKKSP